MEKLKEDWVRIYLSDSKQVDLPCLRNSKGIVIKVFDYAGKELTHNAEARSVLFHGVYWSY